MEKEKQLISAQVLFPVIEELLAEGRQAAFTVTGMSMWPLLRHGSDSVTVEACPPDTPKKGDIVLLQTALGNYLLHRVTRRTAVGIITTGDGNCFRDGEFPRSCIRARVVSFTRNGKTYHCRGVLWHSLSWVWMALFPMRKGLFRFWFRIRKYIRH